MEYCSLNDAFPATDSPPPVGCRGKESSQSAARAEKKKAKRCKAPRMEFVDTNFDEAAMASKDPDRQLEKTDAPQAFKHGAGFAEAYGGIQPVIEPVAPSSQNSATTRAAPKWFGGFVEGVTENFTPYTGTVSDPGTPSEEVQENSEEYMLQPAFNKSLKEFGGVNKATGPILPLPNLSDRWKPMTPGGQTAFFERIEQPAPANSSHEMPTDSIEIKRKLDRIFERLDQIEQQRSCTDNNNTEVGMFVISGVFVLFFMDLLVRKTSTSLRVFNV